MRKLKPSHLLWIASFATLALLFMLAPLTVAQDVQPTQTPLFGDTFGLATPTPMETPIPISLTGVGGRADRGPVAIRSGPGLEFPRIGRLGTGRLIDIVGWNGWERGRDCTPNFQNDLDMWVQVQVGETRGWVARCVLTITGRLTDLPIITASGDRILQR